MELTNAKGRLVIIGGGEDKEGESTILKEFLELAGKAKSRIVVSRLQPILPKKSALK